MHTNDSTITTAQTGYEEAPAQSFRWLRYLLPGFLQPWLRGWRKRRQARNLTLGEPFQSIFPYTQVSLQRQKNLLHICELIATNQVEGAIVECGVLDGGTAALMGHASESSGRPLHLFDAWQGLPMATEKDGKQARKWEGQVVGSPKRVVEILAHLGVSPARVHFHQGWFRETFPLVSIPTIALLHIDCDFYEPTALCLERWYPHLSPGGYIQIDDYASFQGCRMATDEFLTEHPELTLEYTKESGGAYFIACSNKT
jgi:O-methyltransferase